MKIPFFGVSVGHWILAACMVCELAPAQPVSTGEAGIQLMLEGGACESVCWMTIQDVKGSYTIPYIQSARELAVRIGWRGEAQSASIVLLKGAQEVVRKEAQQPAETVTFEHLAPGEYDIETQWRNGAGAEIARVALRRIGIGTVLATIGDSITEGGLGRGFWRESLDLKADMFPSDAVSRNGRNFPQFSPTTEVYKQRVMEVYKQKVNCLQSFMTPLNDGLADAWKQPVFIANEGWGGMTSSSYLRMMKTDRDWQQRIRRLCPRVWLIHLGVNDRGNVSAVGTQINVLARA